MTQKNCNPCNITYKARIGGIMEEWSGDIKQTVWVADVVDCFNGNAHIRLEFATEERRDQYIDSYGYEPVDYDEYDAKIWATIETDVAVPVMAHYDVVFGV